MKWCDPLAALDYHVFIIGSKFLLKTLGTMFSSNAPTTPSNLQQHLSTPPIMQFDYTELTQTLTNIERRTKSLYYDSVITFNIDPSFSHHEKGLHDVTKVALVCIQVLP